MKLPSYTQDWPAEWLHAFQERLSIMEDSGVSDAARKAEADIRRQAGDEGQVQMFGEVA
jgi:hypothetical protein